MSNETKTVDIGKITKGAVTVKEHLGYPGYGYVPEIMGEESSLVAIDDAALIAEAFNVCSETGLSPRQMQERLSEAKDLLHAISDLRPVAACGIDDEIFDTKMRKVRAFLSNT